MIIGMGIDLVDIERIRASVERFGPAFCARVLHEEERTALEGPGHTESPQGEDAAAFGGPGHTELPQGGGKRAVTARHIQSLAARFAAKEAAVKALGTGFAQGIGPHDVRVCTQISGQPEISFHGKARERFRSLGAQRALLSLTHTAQAAAAVVIIED